MSGDNFRDYVLHGWVLCRIREGEKRPRGSGWNRRESGVDKPDIAEGLTNAGLMHAFSGTCAIDIDNVDLARQWFTKHGIDLNELYHDPYAVQIVSGDGNRGKLVYALPEPLPTKQIKNDDKTLMVVEFRCGATTGNSAQDVLPPSTNPRTKQQYAWHYNSNDASWRNLPATPAPLLALWKSLLAPTVERVAEEYKPSASTSELERLIASKNPDCAYDEWCKIGMIIHHETGGSDDGFALWDHWSSKGAKYKGSADLEGHWRSFGTAANPATAGSLRREAVAADDDFGGPVTEEQLDDLAAAEQAEHDAKLARFTWRQLAEYKSRPPPVWLIKGVLPLEPLNMLFGPSGAGKSLIAKDMGLAIARGVSWWDHKTQQGSVGWLAAEAEGSMRNRSRAYEIGHKVSIDDAPFFVLGEGIDLTNRETVKLIAESAPKGLLLIIVDTLAAASGDANENSGEDMNPVMDNCKLLHEITGASVLLIHHSGKDEAKGSRGWSGIKARVQAELEARKRPGTDLRDFTSTKQRDGAEGPVGVFRVEVVEIDKDRDGDTMKSAYVERVTGSDALPEKPARADDGKWVTPIRLALAAAKDMALDYAALETAVLKLVPMGQHTANPRKRIQEALRTMVQIGELLEPGLAGQGPQTYRFKHPETVGASPDSVDFGPPSSADPDGDLL